MATGWKTAGVVGSAGGVATVSSPMGTWIQAHANLTSAQSAGEILAPLSVTSSNVTWIEVPPGATTAIWRARYPTAASAVTVNTPVIAIYSLWATTPAAADSIRAQAPSTDGTVIPMRMDSTDADSTSVTVVTCDTSAADIRDGTYKYSAPVTTFPINAQYGDNFGALFIGALCVTAMAGTAIGTPTLWCLVL